MNNATITLALSSIATTLAVASFCGAIWRIWRDRPRLIFYVSTITFTNLPKGGPMKMMRIIICNIGYRPIVLKGFAALGETSLFSMGINDEPAATYGHEDQRFPTLLSPGETLKIHPIMFDELKRNQTNPEDEKTHYDPWKYFVLVDSFGRLHPIDVAEALFELRISESFRHRKGLRKIWHTFARRSFLRRAKRRWADSF